jgi:hypothetical protein
MEAGLTSKVTLTENTVYFEELQIKHLKIIYKTLIGNDLDSETIFINLNNILSVNTNLNKNISKLNYLDYLLLLLNIRTTSVGNIIVLQLNEQVDTKIEVNTFKLLNTIEQKIKNILPRPQTYNNIKIYYTFPTINEILTITKESSINDVYGFFIRSIEFENKFINLKEYSREEKNLFLENIPAKITSQIIKTVLEIVQKLNTLNILNEVRGLEDKILLLNLNAQNLAAFVKFIFGEQLLALYENIFALCKMGNFTPEYLESCTPGEYLLFVKKLEALNKVSEEQNNIPVGDYDPMMPS